MKKVRGKGSNRGYRNPSNAPNVFAKLNNYLKTNRTISNGLDKIGLSSVAKVARFLGYGKIKRRKTKHKSKSRNRHK